MKPCLGILNILAGFIFIFFAGCGTKTSLASPASGLNGMQDTVKAFMQAVEKDISTNGPGAWLKYFEDTPAFFMANDGQLAFANKDSATNFVNNTLVKLISKITLHWGNQRIDPLTNYFVSIGANYHEDITFSSQKTAAFNGYLTAVASKTPQGWKFRNLHWSSVAKK